MRSSRERNAATTHPRRCRSSRTMGEFYRMTRKRLRRQVVEFVDVQGFDDPQGFDYILNSSKWWNFQSAWLLAQYQLTREVTSSISFPEDHDTDRLFQEMNGNIAGLKQRCLFASFFSSGSLIPIGFEFGFRKRLHVVQTRPEDWETTNVDLRA